MTEEAPNTDTQSDAGGDSAKRGEAARSDGGDPGKLRSTISRPWLVRIVVITLMLVGYGIWSVYDAYISYPERGARYASWSEWSYLTAAKDADDQREDPGILRREAAVEDPVEERRRLRSSEVRDRLDQDLNGSTRPLRAQMELARERWLTALSRVDLLHPAYTNMYANPDPVAYDRLQELESIARADRTAAQESEIRDLEQHLNPQRPRERWAELNEQWTADTQPGMLQSYDIPVNKAAAVGCFAFSLYLIGLFISVAMRTYTWDPSSQRLTLPSGEAMTPDDLADIDKRKWDKFIVFLVLKDSHKSLGGSEVKVDTYRHGLVEGWILEMEKTAFPDRVEAEEKADEPAEAADDEASEDGTHASAAAEDGEKATA
jgi:hypothetical protein